jgi:hypothetical protein
LRLVPHSGPVWGDDEGPPPEPDGKPVIVLGTDVHRVLGELDRHLGALDPLLYQRAHELVTVSGASTKSKIAPGSPVVRTLTAPALVPRVTMHVQCKRHKEPTAAAQRTAHATGQEIRASTENAQPPLQLLASFLAQPDYHHVRHLVGVTESPIFRTDGSLRTEPGYDDSTGYLYVPSCEYPAVDDQPTQAEGTNALRDLVDVFCDFPYVDEPSRYVPISVILSIIARAAIDGPVPGHLFDASVMGSGKTIQCDIAHLIAIGRIPAHATWPAKDEEQEKLLSTYACSGPAAIVLDNVKGVFGGGAIEQTLTSLSVEFRMLGALVLRTLPWRSVVMISGNNIALTDDMIRRTLLSRLESPLEDPTQRTDFKRPELVEWVAAERPRLVTLALTVLRAYAYKGFPDTGVRLASYSAWARVVAGAIRFSGGPDVTQAQPPRERAALDDSGAASVIAANLRLVSLEPLTIKALLAALYPPPDPRKGEPPDGRDDLREAIESLSPARGHATPAALPLAKRLSKFQGRWFGNRKLVSRIDRNGTLHWHVETR